MSVSRTRGYFVPSIPRPDPKFSRETPPSDVATRGAGMVQHEDTWRLTEHAPAPLGPTVVVFYPRGGGPLRSVLDHCRRNRRKTLTVGVCTRTREVPPTGQLGTVSAPDVETQKCVVGVVATSPSHLEVSPSSIYDTAQRRSLGGEPIVTGGPE